jgi:hypothetical protein
VPRTKKAAGQAVDRRNGRHAEMAATVVRKFALPRREPAWLPETKRAWTALWDDPVAGALTPVDRPVLLRWADALDRAARNLVAGDAAPISKGSMGQEVQSPHYQIAGDALRVAEHCEAQLGVGALNRARLGIAILQERSSLAELNARVMDGGSDDDDPR